MSETIFEAQSLCKKYRNKFALEDVCMQVHRGDIYGFIGENGAGKTTLLRILCGLVFPSGGTFSLFGNTEKRDMQQSRKRMGCLIESPSIFPDMTARQNLDMIRTLRGIPGKSCIEEALAAVNLADTGNKKARNFSLGMKQRLGIAMTLLNRPEFLILDEPVNGLDPTNIIELRELLKKMNREIGTTILISSHILSELHQLATVYGFIRDGRMLEQITASQLDEKCKRHILIRVNDAAQAAVILEEKLNTRQFEVYPDHSIRLYDFLDNTGVVSSALTQAGLVIEEISVHGDSLETYFMREMGAVRT